MKADKLTLTVLPKRLCVAAAVVAIFLIPPAAEASVEEVVKQLRDNPTRKIPYEFGTKAELSLSANETASLVCEDNSQGVKEIIVARVVTDSERHESSFGLLYIYIVWADGNISGGGTNLQKTSGSKWQLTGSRQSSPCLVITEWNIDGDKVNIVLVASADAGEIKKYQSRPPLSVDDRVECFVRLWSEIKYNFAFFDQVPEVDWDKVLTEYLPKVRRNQTNYEFYRLMTRCVAQLHDGHTNFNGGPAFPPEFPQRPPVMVQCVEDKAIIIGLADTEEIRKAGLKRGMEITHVDGRAVRKILEEDLYPYITASTLQARNMNAYPRLLEGPTDSVALVRIRDIKGKSRTVKLTRTQQGVKKAFLSERPWAGRGALKAGKLSDGIFYVPLDSFGSNKVVDEFDRLFDQISKARGLILDVRTNGGGNSAFADAICSYLTDKPLKNLHWKTRQYLPAFRAWGRKEKWYEGEHDPVQPIKGKKPFLGPVVVLIGPRTFSAAEDFLIPLHTSGRATLVGTRTSGSTGQPLLVRLPGGASVRICTKRDTYPDGREFVGIGVIPDVEVKPTQADVAVGRYANDNDPVLDKGLEVLKAQLKN